MQYARASEGFLRETTIGGVLELSSGSIKTGPFGTKLAASEYASVGVPVISVGEVGYGAILVTHRTKRVGPDVTHRLPEYLLAAGDIVFGRKGAVDRSAWVKHSEAGYFLGSDGIRLRFGAGVDSRFMAFQCQSAQVRKWLLQHAIGTTLASLNEPTLKAVPVRLPPIEEQRGIAAMLGALDDKIESNRHTCHLLRELGHALVVQAGRSRTMHLRDLTISISRGVTPQYADEDPAAPVVVNQKCVRDGWVSLGPARRMMKREVPEQKRVAGGDVLVNSTGMGTLGRVGRWHSGEVFADSHVSIIKTDPVEIGPTLLAYLMFAREVDIEAMATGSTGQTELSPTRLGELKLEAPSEAAGTSIEPVLLSLESRAAAVEAEIASLTRMRDTLLPELLSGRIRVPEAQEAVTDAVVS